MKQLTDIEINQAATLKPISEVVSKSGIDLERLHPYGKHKGKLEISSAPRKAKLILVTAINPTPAGEGKTTTSIALNEAMNINGHNSLIALREPSLGPIFGAKGGATGGGYSQIAPIEDINLHFNGDYHAITSANNLIAAAIDNHIYWGNSLKIKTIEFARCIDMNDRTLREFDAHIKKDVVMKAKFVITAASEMMAIFTLSKDLNDFRKRVDNIIIGWNENDEPVFAKSLNVTGSVIALMKETILPNVVQTLEGNLALVHGGPFANIAHGCNSIIATDTAMRDADYVITEAGFGADLGAEKFLNIKSRVAGLSPELVVVVATIRAIKMQGGVSKNELLDKNVDSLKEGIKVLEQHINIVKSFNLNYIVAINNFVTDHREEKEFVENWLKANGHDFAYSDGWENGGKGAVGLADLVVAKAGHREMKFTYDLNEKIKDKVLKIAKNIYGTTKVEYSDKANSAIRKLEKNNLDNQYICMAKTPASLTDDPKKIGVHNDWTLRVDDISLSNGAGLIVIQCGNVFRMPGLSKSSHYEKIDYNGTKITGLD